MPQPEGFLALGMMEFTAPAAVNRNWLLCILASFLLISSPFLNQGWRPGSVFTSFRQPEAVIKVPETVKPLPESRESDVQLHPLPCTKEISTEMSLPPSASEPVDRTTSQSNMERADAATTEGKCDIFDGRWVYDPTAYPLYEAHQCPFLSDQVTCRKNGRPDSGYEHWRWEATGCEIPRFNGTYMLEKLRGKRVVIIGDSLNRNQWESLACLLYSSTRPSRTFMKLHDEYKIFRALDYDCTVEFFWSPFLVPLVGDEDKPKVLKLEKLPGSAERWRGADIMVFNTGHWWTHRGSMKKWKYLEVKGGLVEEMAEDMAFKTAMKTWARWIDQSVDTAKTTVFFRSVSPEHKRESNHWCYNQTNPITNETYIEWFPRKMISIVERTIEEMRTPVKYLNITRLSEYRRDAHTGVYTTRRGKLLTLDERREAETHADCSHWCLPGLPDTWNVLMYASIVGTPFIFS